MGSTYAPHLVLVHTVCDIKSCPLVDEAMRLQKTNASTVPPENVPQIGTALDAMPV